MLMLRSLSLYGTRSPQELLKASGLTQVKTSTQETGSILIDSVFYKYCFFTEMGEPGDFQL